MNITRARLRQHLFCFPFFNSLRCSPYLGILKELERLGIKAKSASPAAPARDFGGRRLFHEILCLDLSTIGLWFKIHCCMNSWYHLNYNYSDIPFLGTNLYIQSRNFWVHDSPFSGQVGYGLLPWRVVNWIIGFSNHAGCRKRVAFPKSASRRGWFKFATCQIYDPKTLEASSTTSPPQNDKRTQKNNRWKSSECHFLLIGSFTLSQFLENLRMVATVNGTSWRG